MKKLMVVDDEFIVRVGIRSIVNWEEHGYVMVPDASGGTEALEKIELYHPQIVLTDLMMDNMDGFELIRRCSQQYPDISFVVLSSYNDFENVRRAMKMGARDYIFKLTANPDEILQVLDEISAEQESREDAGPQIGGGSADNSDLGSVIQQNLQAIKYNLLRKCLNPALNENEIIARFKSLSLQVNLREPYALIYISIDDFEKLHAVGELKDLQLVKSSMENIALVLGKDVNMEIFSFERGDIIVFVNSGSLKSDSAASDDYTNLKDLFYKIRECIKKYLNFDVSGTISPVLQDAKKLPQVIRICEDTMRCRTAASELWPYNNGQRNEIALVMEYVTKHPGEKMDVPKMAAHVNMSESYFSHLFKKETGISFVDYVNRIRMEAAAGVLENSDLKIADVAARVGIDNPNYFSVLFKKIWEISPQEYRDRLKREKTQNNEGPSKNI